MTKARDIADFKFENIVDTGTTGTKVASGTTAQRGSTTGQWRYNSDSGYFEGRNATSFSTLEPTPTVLSVDVTEVDSQAGGNQTIVITGTNFSSGGVIQFVGNAGTDFNASTTTYNSASQVTAVAPKSSFLNAQEPYKVKFTSSSGMVGTSASGLISVDTSPTWSTSAGNIGTVTEGESANITVSATDPDSDTIAYTETGGTVLTTNSLSLNSSTGVITGTAPTVSNDTTLTFDLRATANSKNADRTFNIIIQDNPLSGVSEFSALNYEGTSNFLSTLSSAGNLREVTSSSTIDTVAGTTWTGTKLIKLNDGGNCGDWTNIVNTIGGSGGWSVVHWGRMDASSDDTLSGSVNQSQASRSLDFYSHKSEWLDWNNITNTSSTSFGSAGDGSVSSNTLLGQGTMDMKVWRFYAYVWSASPLSGSSQTFKLGLSNSGTMYFNTTGSFTITGTSSNSGFMGYSPQASSGVNTYNYEGWTGGWRAFNTALSDAQINFLYNSGKGRF